MLTVPLKKYLFQKLFISSNPLSLPMPNLKETTFPFSKNLKRELLPLIEVGLLGKYLLLLARYVYQALWAVPALIMILYHIFLVISSFFTIHLPFAETGDFLLFFY